MGFMTLQVEKFVALVVDGPLGGEIVPWDLLGGDPGAPRMLDVDDDDARETLARAAPFCPDGTRVVWSAEIVEGWFARMSAPGYLDCTDWIGPYDTAEEAERECREMYGDDDEGES